MNDSLVQDLQLVRDAASAIETGLTTRATPQDQTAASVGLVRAALDDILAKLGADEPGEISQKPARKPARKPAKKSRRR